MLMGSIVRSRFPLFLSTSFHPFTRQVSLMSKMVARLQESSRISQPSGGFPREDTLEIFNVAVKSVLPKNMVQKTLRVENNVLRVQDQVYNLNRNVHVAAFGKAALGMLRAAEDILQDHIVGGIASVPLDIQQTFLQAGKTDLLPEAGSRVRVIEGSPNNIADARAEAAAMEIYQMAKLLSEDDILLTLITGGGSALLPAPIAPITLDDVILVSNLMQSAGASITQLNTVRKNIELLKGGGLAGAANPAKVISLMLSDVIGNSFDMIASGPTVPDYSTPCQCLDLFTTLGITDKVPSSILNHLKSEDSKRVVIGASSALGRKGARLDAVRSGPKPNHECSNAQNVLVGSNQIAVDHAFMEAERRGYLAYVLDVGLEGEACSIGRMLSALAEYICRAMGNKMDPDGSRSLAHEELELIRLGLSKQTINDVVRLTDRACNTSKPICILAAGETVVNVKGTGKGGRSQEMVLASGIDLSHRIPDEEVCCKFDVVLFSGGTDGQDGPTDATGALCDPNMLADCAVEGIDPQSYLDNSDSYNFFSAFRGGKDLFKMGMSGTNVMDMQILIIKAKPTDAE